MCLSIEHTFDTTRPRPEKAMTPMLQLATEPVTVWTDRNRPTRMVWRAERWRVSDTPTPLREAVVHPALTHPLERTVGWRFQGTSESGRSLVFDVRRDGAEWHLQAYYD